MEKINFTLLLCMITQCMLLSSMIYRYKTKSWGSRFGKYVDYFWFIVGTPMLLVSIAVFFHLIWISVDEETNYEV